jgi:Tfp pilus assembly protein FimT
MQGRSRRRGFALVKLLLAITLVGLVLGSSLSGVRALAGSAELASAARVARGHLAYGRVVAIARRDAVTLTLNASGEVVLADASGSVIRRTPLLGSAGFRLDSIRLRPRILRFNARGHAAPGSLYLHNGPAGVRLVVNFLGRVRVEPLP